MASITVSEQLSGVTITSKATVTEKSRSGKSVKLNLAFSTHLSSTGWIGTGLSLTGTVTAYGVSKTVTLKSSSTSWSGSTEHSLSSTMTVNVPANVTNITIRYKIKFDGDSATGTSTTLTLSKVQASVTGVSNFKDTTNPIMYFSNPAGFKIRPYLNFYTSAGGTLLLSLYPNGMSTTGANISSPYTWSLTDAQRKQIRDKLGTRKSCYVAIGLRAYEGTSLINSSSRAATFTNVLKPPIFSNFVFSDVNSVTTALTGNNQKIIKGYSKLKIEITNDNVPTAQNGATMKYFTINGKNYTYSDNFSCEIEGWDKKTISVYAVDSRGISTLVSKTCDFIAYSEIEKGNISVKRENNIEELTKLIYNGTFWNNNFGAVNNDITATYKYKISDNSSFTEGVTTINPTKENNTFSFSDYILGDGSSNGFLIENSYQIDVILSDKLSSVTYSAILGSGIPAMSIYKNNVSIHGGYEKEIGGTQINGNLYLNGINVVEPNSIQLWKPTNEEEYSASYNHFAPFNGEDEITQSTTIGNKLQAVTRWVPFGDRNSANVHGVLIGKNINFVRADASIRYSNPDNSNVTITTFIFRRRGESNVIYGSCSDTISQARYTGKVTYDIPVQEGDFIFVVSYRSSKSVDINVMSENASTSMRVIAIG